jgi:hypothetical protein
MRVHPTNRTGGPARGVYILPATYYRSMRPSVALVRSREDRSLPSVFVPEPKASHRHPKRYSLRFESEADVDVAREHDVPLFFLTDRDMARLHYPMTFPPVLFATEAYREVISAPWITKEAVAPPDHPRDEDTITYLVKMAPLAARAVLDRNLRHLDRDYLARRITEERLNTQATSVRMPERLPRLVPVGPSLPKDQLDRVLAGNRAP